MTQTDLLYSEFKSLVISLVSDYILKIKNFDESKREINYKRLRNLLAGVCEFTNATDVERSWIEFYDTLEEVGVSAPIIDNFLSVLVRSTPNEHHEWKTGNMHGVVVEQVRTRLGDEFPVDLSL